MEEKNVPEIDEEHTEAEIPEGKDDSKISFPWVGLIITGVLVIAAIICIVVIFQFGGPVNPK